MKPLGKTNTHYWLAQQMAKITETDLVTAMEKAELTQADWAEMVTACRGCNWGDKCQKWLDLHPEPVETAPKSCCNGTRYEALREALEDMAA
ncbi:DUF6455 family protein [Shimia biformata]|uniref:DUF6455 family protein n=1 Tax=Shimia biformata TaxID=1294299 RepID=UPI0019513164|nr:DUF6455 family protein [Shimia biformata]